MSDFQTGDILMDGKGVMWLVMVPNGGGDWIDLYSVRVWHQYDGGVSSWEYANGRPGNSYPFTPTHRDVLMCPDVAAVAHKVTESDPGDIRHIVRIKQASQFFIRVATADQFAKEKKPVPVTPKVKPLTWEWVGGGYNALTPVGTFRIHVDAGLGAGLGVWVVLLNGRCTGFTFTISEDARNKASELYADMVLKCLDTEGGAK